MPNTFTAKPTFVADERGSVAVIFGLMFIVITFMAGMAIDYGRVRHTESKFAAAADAAVLAGGRALLSGGSQATAEAVTLKFFEENVNAGGSLHASYPAPVINVDMVNGGVSLSVSPVVQMTLTSVLGFETIAVPVAATTTFDQKDVELSMQLDLTGSMCSPCSKISALKDATNNLINILLPDGGTTNKVRIALAPYSAGVNVGSYASTVTGGQNGSSSCAYDRPGFDADSDEAPATSSFFQGKLDLPTAGNCPSQQIMPLTDDKSALTSAVNAFTTGGTTAGQLGTNWAWNLLSPKWNSIWPTDSEPVAYSDTTTVKTAILMTDGEYNTFDGKCDSGGCTAYGTRGTQSNDHAKAMCANMKAQGIVVYTVGFAATEPKAIETLSSCATSADHFYQASDASALNQAFIAIAQQINNLRLTN